MVEITVGLPVCNGSKTLARALDQMRAQTFHDFCLVVSDNASTDETEGICNRYARLDSRIIYRRRRTRVPGSENFRGLLMDATTPYFMWISHDDIWHPEFIAKCYECLQKQPNVICAVTRSKHIYEDGSSRLDRGTSPLRGEPRKRLRDCLRHLDGNHRLYGLFRTEALQRSFPLSEWYFAYDWLVTALSTCEGEHDEVPEVLFEKFANPRFHYFTAASFESRNRWEQILPCLRFSRELHARVPRRTWWKCFPEIFILNLIACSQQLQYRYSWTRRPIRLIRQIQKAVCVPGPRQASQ